MIADLIRAEGPVTVERYFQLCAERYYATREPFGADGDFVTAPEYSQLFGEMIGVWCAAAFEAMGRPAGLKLVELGPGRGTLMADVVKASKLSAEVHLVESSARLRAVQKAALENAGAAPVWHHALTEVPAGPAIIIANEFFDALPVRQYEFRDGWWHERLVGLGRDGALRFGLSPVPIGSPTDAAIAKPSAGALIETSPAREDVMRVIAARGAVALVIDYGHGKTAFGDTLQAMKAHRFAGVLETPGDADLTAHVDFAALARAAEEAGGAVHGPMEQGAFLKAMGLEVRAARLAAKADEPARAYLADSVQRLAGADAMGRLFKVMAVTPRGMAAPYPFGSA